MEIDNQNLKQLIENHIKNSIDSFELNVYFLCNECNTKYR
jgi:Fe2+ or Zn2+ uptake regulation protein